MKISLSPLGQCDLPAVSKLFDASLGSGFWKLDGGFHEYCQVATIDGALIGAAVAALIDRLDEAPDLRGPVGLVRLVAVRETARRQGTAPLLVESLSHICLDATVTSQP